MTNLREYLLDNVDELKSIVGELNSWNGCLEHLEVHENNEEFFNVYFEGNPMEAVRAASFGDYEYLEPYVRFNGYGNLETLEDYELEEELKSYVDDVIEELKENQDNICLPAEVKEILEEE